MKFEININKIDIPAVKAQVESMQDVALHNLGNAMVRGNGECEREYSIAKATTLIHDIISVITDAATAEELGEDPKDYSYGQVCCKYIGE